MSHAWMPLAIDDYLADTRHLTTLEHGAYLLLIMRYWQKAGLPTEDRMVQRIAGLSDDQWAESRAVLASFFEEGWRHPRIDAELEKAADIIEKRKSAANRRHGASKLDAHAVQMQSTCSDTRVPPLPSTLTSDASASDASAPAPKMIGNWPEADVARARQDLVAAYGGGLDAPADVAGTFNTWVAAYGWEPAVIVTAVAGRITDPEKRKKPLRYWENAVREVFTKRAATPPPAEPAQPPVPRHANFEKVAWSTWHNLVDVWKINRKWSEYYGPAPNEPGCHVPPEILERFNVKPAQQVLQ